MKEKQRSWLCLGGNVYEFEGVRFEWHRYSGPWPIDANGNPLDELPDGFWQMVDRFQQLSADEKAGCLVARGGCIPLMLGEKP